MPIGNDTLVESKSSVYSDTKYHISKIIRMKPHSNIVFGIHVRTYDGRCYSSNTILPTLDLKDMADTVCTSLFLPFSLLSHDGT